MSFLTVPIPPASLNICPTWIRPSRQHIVLGTIGNAINMKFITDSCRNKFIDSLISSLGELNLDGIDVDLEGDHIDKDYEGFVGALSTALKAQGKLMTAAVATWESAQLTDKALTYFDFLNIMTYDAVLHGGIGYGFLD
jgi:GH18 family chitinase